MKDEKQLLFLLDIPSRIEVYERERKQVALVFSLSQWDCTRYLKSEKKRQCEKKIKNLILLLLLQDF